TNDPEPAKECIRENMILRRIGKSSVEETEGYFVRTPEDDPAFEPRWVTACRACGIDVEEVPLAEALRREPNLTRDALAVYRVPDSAVDGFRLVWHNVMSARRYGGDIRTYSKVTAIHSANGKVTGVSLLHCKTGEKETIPCELVINATGSWAGEVASLAGMAVSVAPDRGTLLTFNHRFTNRVVNRLRKSSDGDIFVPHGSIVIFGTTSIPTDNPGDTRPRSEDVLYLLGEAEPLLPKIRAYRMLRAFAGTRPLYSPSAATGRAATRNFVIIDHEEEGLSGMITVTGGKFTSFRLMAEKTVDAAAKKLGVTVPCRTAEESIIPCPDEALMRRAGRIFPSESSRLAVSRLGDDLE
ncbi:MAG: FAD-dependent oxidoreductase, partial [Deltaproteobacteria bacterium]|nr:FAD-dependent oxidoreductase [Deltaproteobacteria bacterium]